MTDKQWKDIVADMERACKQASDEARAVIGASLERVTVKSEARLGKLLQGIEKIHRAALVEVYRLSVKEDSEPTKGASDDSVS